MSAERVVLLIARDPVYAKELSALLAARSYQFAAWTDAKVRCSNGGEPPWAVLAAGDGREIAAALSREKAASRAIPPGTLVIAVEDPPAAAEAWTSVPCEDLIRLAGSGDAAIRRASLLPAIDGILQRESAAAAARRREGSAGETSSPTQPSSGEFDEKYDKLKTDFISLISHELRTPLATIIGFAEIISSGLHESPQELDQMMKGILQSGLELDGFISDAIEFLQWTERSIRLTRAEFDLVPHVRRILREVSEEYREKSIRVSFRGLSSLITVGDAGVISSALERMIDNAFKFSNLGGAVEFSLEKEERPEAEGGATAVIKLRDHGIGLHRRQIERLFHPLEIGGDIAHHTSGHGLGLVIAQECVRSHQGRLSVQSEGPGKGCLVVLELPIGPLFSSGTARSVPLAEVQIIA